MKYVKLGNTGVDVSKICLGMMSFGKPGSEHGLFPWARDLKRLNLDYVDLYTIHRLDPLTPMEETMEALHDVVRSGKARYLGASTMYLSEASAQTLRRAHAVQPVAAMQSEYSLWARDPEAEVIPACEDSASASFPGARSGRVSSRG